MSTLKPISIIDNLNTTKDCTTINQEDLSWVRKANKILAEYEMLYRDFSGFTITTKDIDLMFSEFPNIPFEEKMSIDEKILRARIFILQKYPNYVVSQINYCIAFERVYSKAAFREYVINEHERYIQNVLSITSNSQSFAELSQYWENEPARPVGLFLMNLAVAYEKEYRFEDALKIYVEIIIRKAQVVSDLGELFWKMNKIKEGFIFFNHMKSKSIELGINPTVWELASEQLDRFSRGKPYKPRPRKKSILPQAEILRFKP